MSSTVVVAAMGLVATVLAAWLSSWSNRRAEREGQLLEARVRVYGECSESLFEYARANFNRAKTRIAGQPEEEHGKVREEAYPCNARARSAIGQAAILTGQEALEERLSSTRHVIGSFNDVTELAELTQRQHQVHGEIKAALEVARRDLMPDRPRARHK
jgi:sRNA-binding protein